MVDVGDARAVPNQIYSYCASITVRAGGDPRLPMAVEGVAVGFDAIPRYCDLECCGTVFDGQWGNLGPIPYLFTFYAAAGASIPAIIAAELAAYAARRRQQSRNN